MDTDLFSSQSDLYAKYRPGYSSELIDYTLSFVNEKNTAWDCATGNGQAAVLLAKHFNKVFATDISLIQINNAVLKPNIEYSLSPAESTLFADNNFDLITVAQAYHWIDQKAFFTEACRVAKNDCVIAVWMYAMFTTNNEKLNALMHHLEYDITGPFWHKNRIFVDEKYETVQFDFDKLPVKDFSITELWSKEQITGYISSWSATQKYIEANGYSPLSIIDKDLNAILNDEEIIDLEFPIYLKLGRIVK